MIDSFFFHGRPVHPDKNHQHGHKSHITFPPYTLDGGEKRMRKETEMDLVTDQLSAQREKAVVGFLFDYKSLFEILNRIK